MILLIIIILIILIIKANVSWCHKCNRILGQTIHYLNLNAEVSQDSGVDQVRIKLLDFESYTRMRTQCITEYSIVRIVYHIPFLYVV